MNRVKIAKEIATVTNLPDEKVIEVIDLFLSDILKTLKKGQKVVIYRFGTFKPVVRNRRVARNPKTGQKVTIPSYRTIKFLPSISVKIL